MVAAQQLATRNRDELGFKFARDCIAVRAQLGQLFQVHFSARYARIAERHVFCRKGVVSRSEKTSYGFQKIVPEVRIPCSRVDNSLLPQKNSLLGIQKFPAPSPREFGL
jgi:hypothetical protein